MYAIPQRKLSTALKPWKAPKEEAAEAWLTFYSLFMLLFGTLGALITYAAAVAEQGPNPDLDVESVFGNYLVLLIALILAVMALAMKANRRVEALENQLKQTTPQPEGQHTTARDTAASRPTGSRGVN